jgi:hypothetical protein
MNELGWIVISRAHPGSHSVSVIGVLDPEIVKDEEAALQLLRTNMPEAEECFRIAAFGMMKRKLEHVSKRNLASALRRLGLAAGNVNEVYDGIARFICSLAKQPTSH